MDSHRKRSTLHRLSLVCPMNDNHEGPVPPAGATVFRQHQVYDVLVEGDAERLRQDQCDPWTTESRIVRLEFDDGPNEGLTGPFGPGFWGHRLDENRRQYLRRTKA